MNSGQIILFQTQGGEAKIEVRFANESVWLQGWSYFNAAKQPFQGIYSLNHFGM